MVGGPMNGGLAPCSGMRCVVYEYPPMLSDWILTGLLARTYLLRETPWGVRWIYEGEGP